MDLEFYARSLLGRPPSPPAAPEVEIAKPRELDADFATRVVSAVESSLAPSLDTTPSDLSERAAAKRRALSLEYNRVLTSGAFGDGRGYDTAIGVSGGGPISSQYEFDLALLGLFTLLADARLPRERASECSRLLGDTLLAAAMPSPSAAAAAADAAGTPTLKSLITGMRQLLTALQTNGYLQTYNLDDSDGDEALWAQKSDLSPTRLTLTLTDTASLRAALLLNGRSGASPELAKPLLLAYLRARGVGIEEVGEFFLDGTYRQSPLEYRPNQQILTLTIRPR